LKLSWLAAFFGFLTYFVLFVRILVSFFNAKELEPQFLTNNVELTRYPNLEDME